MNKNKIREIIRDEISKVLEITSTLNVAVYQGNNLLTPGVDANHHVCTCPNCGAKVSNLPGEDCKTTKCPQCGNLMVKINETL